MRPDGGEITQAARQQERRQQCNGKQPAKKADLAWFDGIGGQFADDRIGRPDQHGQQGKAVIHDGCIISLAHLK